MPHATPLIATIVGGIVLAFLFGALAMRLRMPPLVGYLLAGVFIGPFTPGFVADQHIANELAELGVILLMFGVGLHFSMKDLLAVRKVAIPGAVVQISVAVMLGWGLATLMGWDSRGGIVFGLALSVASTVVLLRAMEKLRLLDTDRGRIAVGWLIVEDLAMVIALVLIPALAGAGTEGGSIGGALLITIAKLLAFVTLMLIVGRRVVPAMLHAVAHTGSRELFRLAVLAIALGVAFGAAALFGVSFALGAFFAGMILAESPLSQRAAEETLPLRDAFAVLFFVSIGMLFDPMVIVNFPLALLGTLFIIIIGKSVAAFTIVRLFGHPPQTALTISASLAQIGEFSFILGALGVQLNLFPPEARDLILAGAILTILFNPVAFLIAKMLTDRMDPNSPEQAAEPESPPDRGKVVLVGHGRVGSRVARELVARGQRLTVIEAERDVGEMPTDPLATVIRGNAAAPGLLARSGIQDARMLIVAIPEPFEAGQIVQQARALNPELRIVARAHSDEEQSYLNRCGADLTIMGENEIARRMIEEVKR